MNRAIPWTLPIVLVSTLSWSQQSAPPSAEQTVVREVQLVSGSTLRARKVERDGLQIILTLENGAMIAFQMEDVDPQSLEQILENSGQQGAGSPEQFTGTSQNTTSIGSRVLILGGHESDPNVPTIEITGQRRAIQAEEEDRYEEMRQEALQRLEDLAKAHSDGASQLTTKMREYVSGCYGTTRTYHTTKKSGVGLTQGTIDSTVDGSWVAGNSDGQRAWGGYSGEVQSDVYLTTIWSQTEHTTSTTKNSETPHCKGLFGEIHALYGSIGPQFTNAIVNARLSYVLDSETNAVLTKYGIGTVDVWMVR